MRLHLAFLVLLVTLTGCSGPKSDPPKPEGDVRQAFVAVQEALKARDADKVWPLLAAESQADADKAAQAVRDAYAKADAGEKEKQEKALGLPGKELAALKGLGFLKTRVFLELELSKELPTSKIDKVTVQGDQATVDYTEPDDEKEKLTFAREDGKWKAK